MTVEFLERIGSGYHHDLWLVRIARSGSARPRSAAEGSAEVSAGTLGQAQVYDGSHPDWEHEVDAQTQPWVGFTHPRVVPVLSSARTSDRLVIVHGDERGPMITHMASLLKDPSERVRWVVEQIAGVAEAIAMAAWRKPGFVHRRPEPYQIVVGPDGQARLRSFVAFMKGPASGTYTGQANSFSKLAAYMSPEQARGGALTPATDVHGLASTLYGCLAGRAPFARDTDIETVMAIMSGAPPALPEGLPRALGALLEMSLAGDPARRPPDPATFAAELRRCMPEPLPPDLLTRVASLRPDARPAPHESELIVGNRCSKQWDELSPTGADGVRHCESCKHDVVQVRSLHALVPLLGNRCVSFKPDGN